MIGQLLNRYLKGFEAKRILDVGPGYNNFGCISARITGATHITYVDNDSDVLNWQYHACQKALILCNCLLFSLDEVFDLDKLGYSYDISQGRANFFWRSLALPVYVSRLKPTFLHFP